MTYDDAAVDTTRKFIIRDKGYLKLALFVEKAALGIRNGAVEKILTRVHKHLTQRFCSQEWTVDFVGPGKQTQAVRIKKRSWQCGGTAWPEWEGVRLDRSWKGANITVSSFENVKPDKIRDVFDELKIGGSRISGSYVYCRLEGNLKDWEVADFVFDAWHKPGKIAEDLAQKMEKLARKIDDVFY